MHRSSPPALLVLGPLLLASTACARHPATATGPAATPATPTPAATGPAAPWSSDFAARVTALAVLQTLNAELLSHDSATLTLDRWCDTHRLASPAKIAAVRDKTTTKPPTPEVRKALGVSDQEPIRYRRVKLTCGAHVLSEADNWYVPARLTPEMNRVLETSDTPFGRAVQALHFQRRTLAAKLLWSPLPDGWDMAPVSPEAGAATLRVPHEVLQHQAVLVLPDGTPFSQVVETYTEAVLGFPQPKPAGP
jgi:chorismate-pyruvate lyase